MMKTKAIRIMIALLVLTTQACSSSIDLVATETAQANNDAASLTAAAPTNTSTLTPAPTITKTPLPPTRLPLGKISGKVFWLEGGGPAAAYLYLIALETEETQEYAVHTNGVFSFVNIEPGTYAFIFEIALDNPVFDPCSGMSFNDEAEGISYTMGIVNGEFAYVTGTSELFVIAAGDNLNIDIPFSFICH
jgi:hypothetical protein